VVSSPRISIGPAGCPISRDYAGQMGKARVVEKRINIPERVSFGPGRRQNSKTPVPRTNVLYIYIHVRVAWANCERGQSR
jgi:hypothetical protein